MFESMLLKSGQIVFDIESDLQQGASTWHIILNC